MKKLYHNDETYRAEKVVKTNTDIIGFNNYKETFAFRGIKDWSQFNLEDGQEWDLAKEDEQALYQIDLDYRVSILEMGVDIHDL